MTKLLTDEQLDVIMRDNNPLHSYVKFARAIEAAVLEAHQAGQEEVGYVGEYVLPTKTLKAGTPLYAAPVVQPGSVDCIGLALDLEARAKTVESQTTERAMISAANGLRLIAAAEGKK